MQSIFLKIYGGVIITVLIVGLLANSAALHLNRYRLENYIQSISSGTFYLIEEAVQRQQPEQRQHWLEVVEKLTDVSVDLLPLQHISFTQGERQRLAAGELLVKTHDGGKNTHIYKALSEQPDRVLHTRLFDINEQLSRLSALLILNELQRHPDRVVAEMLADLNKRFNFHLALWPMEGLQLSYAQLRLLQRHEMVIHLQEDEFAKPSISAYAPMPESDKVLQVGPVEFFEWAPVKQIYWMVFISFAVITFICYLLIRPLQKRLNRLADEVSDIGSDRVKVQVTGNDVLTHLASNINDMSERIQHLLSTQKELVQAVSHELRTPIARINFHLAILEEHLPETETKRVQKYIDGIYQDADDLEHLVDEILSYAMLERAEPDLNIASFNLHSELHKLVAEITPMRQQIQFTIDVPVELRISADAHYFMRACKNLLVNAQRHAHSQVQASLLSHGNSYHLVIDDDGPGIPEQHRETVLQPFMRLDASRNRASGGYGLGLAIVFQIMRWHHGTVTVEDAPLGGCRFSLRWPKP